MLSNQVAERDFSWKHRWPLFVTPQNELAQEHVAAGKGGLFLLLKETFSSEALNVSPGAGLSP